MLVLGCTVLAAAVLTAGPAIAATTSDDAPVPVCYTYFPSDEPTDAGTGIVAPSGSGTASDTAAAGDTTATSDAGDTGDVAAPTDVDATADSSVATDSGAPTDAGVSTDTVSTDTAVPTEVPSGVYTACAEPAVAGGGAGPGSTDPLAYSGSDTAVLALIAAALLGLGIALSVLTARRASSRHTH